MTSSQTVADNDAASDLHRVISCTEEGGTERISAFGVDNAEICGAFKRAGHCTWSIYVTTSVARTIGSCRLGSMLPHVQVCGRQHATRWVELIARLYIAADC